MPLWVKIYLIGWVFAMYLCTKTMEDESKRITFGELVIALFMSMLSWIIVLALWVGRNIKRSEDNRNEDEFDNFK